MNSFIVVVVVVVYQTSRPIISSSGVEDKASFPLIFCSTDSTDIGVLGAILRK